jgi:hypothetical protein
MMNDGNLVRWRQQVLDQVTMPHVSTDFADNAARAARPLSWHPSSHIPPPQVQVTQPTSQYPFPAFNDSELYQSYQHFSPTPATYSCNTSPSATFSPLALPFNSLDTSPYAPAEGWNVSTQPTPSYVSSTSESCNGFPEQFPPLSTTMSSGTAPSLESLEWNSFVLNGFNSTSPPTPETLPPVQQFQPTMPSEESIPYQPLEEAEEEGEILVGMGLYDAPSKYDSDPQLDNYRSTMSQLLGATYRPPQPMGKGLKLEESWQPPPDSDDEEDDAEGEGDAEDDEQDGGNPKEQESSVPATATAGRNWA